MTPLQELQAIESQLTDLHKQFQAIAAEAPNADALAKLLALLDEGRGLLAGKNSADAQTRQIKNLGSLADETANAFEAYARAINLLAATFRIYVAVSGLAVQRFEAWDNLQSQYHARYRQLAGQGLDGEPLDKIESGYESIVNAPVETALGQLAKGDWLYRQFTNCRVKAGLTHPVIEAILEAGDE